MKYPLGPLPESLGARAITPDGKAEAQRQDPQTFSNTGNCRHDYCRHRINGLSLARLHRHMAGPDVPGQSNLLHRRPQNLDHSGEAGMRLPVSAKRFLSRGRYFRGRRHSDSAGQHFLSCAEHGNFLRQVWLCHHGIGGNEGKHYQPAMWRMQGSRYLDGEEAI